MNPAFILIVLIVLVALWFLLSFAFRPLGKLLHSIWKDAMDAMDNEDEKEKSSEGVSELEMQKLIKKSPMT